MAHSEIVDITMIHVRMGDDEVFYSITDDAVSKKMMIGIGGKIDKKIVVYDRLRASSYVLSAESSCLVTMLAVTKERGKSLCGGSAQKSKLHRSKLLSILIEKRKLFKADYIGAVDSVALCENGHFSDYLAARHFNKMLKRKE